MIVTNAGDGENLSATEDHGELANGVTFGQPEGKREEHGDVPGIEFPTGKTDSKKSDENEAVQESLQIYGAFLL